LARPTELAATRNPGPSGASRRIVKEWGCSKAAEEASSLRGVQVCVKEGGHGVLRMARVMMAAVRMAAVRMTATRMTTVLIANRLRTTMTTQSPRCWKVDLHMRQSDAATVDGGLLAS